MPICIFHLGHNNTFVSLHPLCIGLCYFYDSQKANRLPKDLFFLRR